MGSQPEKEKEETMKKVLLFLGMMLPLFSSGCVDFYIQHELGGFNELKAGDTIHFSFTQSSSRDWLKLYSRGGDGKEVSFYKLEKDSGLVFIIKDHRGEVVYSSLVGFERIPRDRLPGQYTMEIVISPEKLEFLQSRKNYLEVRRSYYIGLPQPSIKVWKKILRGAITRGENHER